MTIKQSFRKISVPVLAVAIIFAFAGAAGFSNTPVAAATPSTASQSPEAATIQETEDQTSGATSITEADTDNVEEQVEEADTAGTPEDESIAEAKTPEKANSKADADNVQEGFDGEFDGDVEQ